MTGYEVAESFLAWKNVTCVEVKEGPNAYSPLDRVITLQHEVYHGHGASAATVAAHEAAHAIQHAERYALIRVHIVLVVAAFFSLPIMFGLLALSLWYDNPRCATWSLLCAPIPIASEIIKGVIEVDAWERAREFARIAGIEIDETLAKQALHTYIFGTMFAMAKLALRRRG